MGFLVWVMVGIALWHFTVFLPDRFWAGIVGAFLGAVVGAVISGLLLAGFVVPGADDTNLLTAFEAVPGTILGIAAIWYIGMRSEDPEAELG